MSNCITNIVIGELPEDKCKGKTISTECVISEDAFTLLGLSTNEKLSVILNTFVIALNSQKALIDSLEADKNNLEARINILESYH